MTLCTHYDHHCCGRLPLVRLPKAASTFKSRSTPEKSHGCFDLFGGCWLFCLLPTSKLTQKDKSTQNEIFLMPIPTTVRCPKKEPFKLLALCFQQKVTRQDLCAYWAKVPILRTAALTKILGNIGSLLTFLFSPESTMSGYARYSDAHDRKYGDPHPVPIVPCTAETLGDLGRLVFDFDQEEVWITTWPQPG